MKDVVQSVPRELDHSEMLELIGGDDPGGSIAHDVGYWIGYAVGSVERWFATIPTADYAYGKVGYSS